MQILCFLSNDTLMDSRNDQRKHEKKSLVKYEYKYKYLANITKYIEVTGTRLGFNLAHLAIKILAACESESTISVNFVIFLL